MVQKHYSIYNKLATIVGLYFHLGMYFTVIQLFIYLTCLLSAFLSIDLNLMVVLHECEYMTKVGLYLKKIVADCCSDSEQA